MIDQYDKIALCSHVQQGKVRYYKEYTLKDRIVGSVKMLESKLKKWKGKKVKVTYIHKDRDLKKLIKLYP